MALSADRPGRRSRMPSWLRSLWTRRWFRRSTLAVAVLVALGVASIAFAYAAISLPETPEQAQTTVVLDADGNLLAELYDEENRVDVPLEEVAPVVVDAVLAAEDRHFYGHRGLNPFSVGRAFLANIRGKDLQGGSTITQQLVKNTYLTPERSIVRKAREAILSIKVEQQWSKDEILERYLNTVYFGRGAYGIEKAAELWFGTTAQDLTLPQAAMLAGAIRAPETADPDLHPDEAARRRDIVLAAMVDTGAISRDEAEAAQAEPITTADRRDPDAQLTGSSAYFVAQVRGWLIERYGERVAFGGGLRVHTTLRKPMQDAAERAVFDTLNVEGDPDAALVALDDRGAVVAMIGGRDFATSNVNLAMGAAGGGQGRQPGSTFKPFVLAAALESGIPVTQRFSAPSKITAEVDGVEYPVENYNGESFGQMDLIEATAKSVNTAYIQLAAEVGIRPVAELANELGVTAELEPYPALALGSEEVSPLDMARSYMTFANRGERITPFFVESVEDSSGASIYAAEPERTPVYPRQYADLMNHVLAQTIERGTGRAADIGRPAAGKTGTTSNNTDAWFVGYTPRLGAAVWMGYKDGTSQRMERVHGRPVTGGGLPAQIWAAFMEQVTAGVETGEFEPPPDELLRARQVETSSDVTATSVAPEPTTTTSSTSSSTTTTSTTEPTEETTTTTTTGDGGGGGDGRPTTTTTTTAPPQTTTTATTAPPSDTG
jgi:penicillin-binding protein 1A